MKECCQDENNLGPYERMPEAVDGEVFRRCKVCGCRHFTFYAEPGIIGIKGA